MKKESSFKQLFLAKTSLGQNFQLFIGSRKKEAAYTDGDEIDDGHIQNYRRGLYYKKIAQ